MPHLPARPLLYAHRGAAAERPENTMESFHRALELGADALEMDVHMSADGRIVVSHDPTGARMCGVGAEIRRTRWDDLRRWDAGHGFVAPDGNRPFAGCGVRLPALDEVLLEFPEVPLNIDLKQRSPDMVPAVFGLLRRLDAEERVLVASFHLRNLVALRAYGYRGHTALSLPEVAALAYLPAPLFRLLPLVGDAAQVPVRGGGVELGSRRFIDKCHRLGIRVDFWTINDPNEARRLLDLGADGIMTDDPARIAPVFGRGGTGGRDADPGAATNHR